MQLESSTNKKDIDKDIKKYTHKLKELIAQKQGLTLEQLEFRQKEKAMSNNNRRNAPIQFNKNIDVSRFREIVFKFRCPDCHGTDTKRNGTTTQLETKARFLCYNCQHQRIELEDKSITPFFVLSNDEMKQQILSNKYISQEQKKQFLEKYIIKK